MKREHLIKSKEYLISQIQLGMLNLIAQYKDSKKLKDFQLAEEFGVSKGYVSQILHASFDHKISKLVELTLACKKVPLVFFVPIEEYLQNDQADKVYEIFPVIRPRSVSYQTEEVVIDTRRPKKNTWIGFNELKEGAKKEEFSATNNIAAHQQLSNLA